MILSSEIVVCMYCSFLSRSNLCAPFAFFSGLILGRAHEYCLISYLHFSLKFRCVTSSPSRSGKRREGHGREVPRDPASGRSYGSNTGIERLKEPGIVFL